MATPKLTRNSAAILAACLALAACGSGGSIAASGTASLAATAGPTAGASTAASTDPGAAATDSPPAAVDSSLPTSFPSGLSTAVPTSFPSLGGPCGKVFSIAEMASTQLSSAFSAGKSASIQGVLNDYLGKITAAAAGGSPALRKAVAELVAVSRSEAAAVTSGKAPDTAAAQSAATDLEKACLAG